MIINCPKCDSRYAIDASAVGGEGRKVRCTKCGHVWLQKPATDLPRQVSEKKPVEKPVPSTPKKKAAKSLSFFKKPAFIGWAIFFCIVGSFLTTGYYARETVVKIFPQSKFIYELFGIKVWPVGFGLAITDVTSSQEIAEDGEHYLTVRGYVVNLTEDTKELPKIECVLYNIDEKPIKNWAFSAEKQTLNAKERVPFYNQLKSPPPEAKGFNLHFVEVKE